MPPCEMCGCEEPPEIVGQRCPECEAVNDGAADDFACCQVCGFEASPNVDSSVDSLPQQVKTLANEKSRLMQEVVMFVYVCMCLYIYSLPVSAAPPLPHCLFPPCCFPLSVDVSCQQVRTLHLSLDEMKAEHQRLNDQMMIKDQRTEKLKDIIEKGCYIRMHAE